MIGIFGPLEQGQMRDLSVMRGDLTIYGPQGGDDQAWLGESVAIGDFNGDGVGDLLTGARQANGFDIRNESGIVYMFYGGPSLEETRDLHVVSADITLVGANARDFTGYVTAGDLTGDGLYDITTSATDRATPDGDALAGAGYIRFVEDLSPTPTPALTPQATPTPPRTVPPTSTPPPTPPLPLAVAGYFSWWAVCSHRKVRGHAQEEPYARSQTTGQSQGGQPPSIRAEARRGAGHAGLPG